MHDFEVQREVLLKKLKQHSNPEVIIDSCYQYMKAVVSYLEESGKQTNADHVVPFVDKDIAHRLNAKMLQKIEEVSFTIDMNGEKALYFALLAQIQHTKSQSIKRVESQMQTFKDEGLDPITAISNETDGPKLLKFFLQQEGIKFFDEHAKSSDQYSLLEKFFEFMYEVFGAEYKTYDINSLDQRGNGVLHSLYTSSEMIETVVDKFNADINLQNSNGETTIMKAVEHGVEDSVKYLLDKGANVTIQDNKGENIMHKLAKQFNENNKEWQLEIVESLKQTGKLEELLAQRDKDGKTPLDYARKNENAIELTNSITKLSKVLGVHTQNAMKNKSSSISRNL